MARLTRQEQKIFAENVLGSANQQVGVYGSHKANPNSPEYAATPNDVQKLTNFEDGWNGSTENDSKPSFEDSNGILFALTYNVRYLMQRGIAEHSNLTDYYIGSLVTSGNVLYRSLTDANIGNAVTDVAHWEPFTSGGSGGVGTNGWTPQISFEPATGGLIVRITDWVLGTGTKPPIGYLGPNGMIVGTAMDAEVIPITGGGGGGTDGADGNDGWTPYLAFENVATGFVVRVNSWLLGTGTPPVTGYIGAGGAIVQNIVDAEILTIPGGGGSSQDLRTTNYEYIPNESKMSLTVADADSNPTVERKFEPVITDAITTGATAVSGTGAATVTLSRRQATSATPNLIIDLPRLNQFPLQSGAITGTAQIWYSVNGTATQRRIALSQVLTYINGALSGITESQLDSVFRTKISDLEGDLDYAIDTAEDAERDAENAQNTANSAVTAAAAAQATATTANTTADAASDAAAELQVSWAHQGSSQNPLNVDFSQSGAVLSDGSKTLIKTRLGITNGGGTGYDPSVFTEETTAELTDEVVGRRGADNIRLGLDTVRDLIGGSGGGGGLSFDSLSTKSVPNDGDNLILQRETPPAGAFARTAGHDVDFATDIRQ